MKTLKYFGLIFFSLLCTSILYGQVPIYTADAVRFSQTDGGGTARFVGLGGANVSLGGDISSISGNPAGLGFYNGSGWAISPVLRIGDFSAEYQGNRTENMGGNFQVPNMGIVIQNKFEEYAGSKWISGTFGIAVNQKQSFYNNINYRGTINPGNNGIPNDFMDYMLSPFINETGNLKLYPTIESINPDLASNAYSDLASLESVGLLTIFEVENGNGDFIGYEVDRYDFAQLGSVVQTENINTYSGLTTLDLSYGANYNDIIYLGAALNVNFLNYRQERRFIERPSNDILNYYEINEETNISGTGAALTIGVIYKPINRLNVGITYNSPTIMSLSEIQDIRMDAFYTDATVGEAELTNEVPSYSFLAPQKVSAGATAFLSKYGFITADLEYVDYSSARYNSSNGAFGDDAPEVGNDLQSTYNLKVGAEGRWNILRARVGFAYFDNPYKEFEQNRQSISAGFGIMKENGFFIDATYRLSSFTNPNFRAYPGGSIVSSESNISSLRFTIGKNF